MRKILKIPIKTVISDYIPQEFYDMAKGLEDCPEGGAVVSNVIV